MNVFMHWCFQIAFVFAMKALIVRDHLHLQHCTFCSCGEHWGACMCNFNNEQLFRAVDNTIVVLKVWTYDAGHFCGTFMDMLPNAMQKTNIGRTCNV